MYHISLRSITDLHRQMGNGSAGHYLRMRTWTAWNGHLGKPCQPQRVASVAPAVRRARQHIPWLRHQGRTFDIHCAMRRGDPMSRIPAIRSILVSRTKRHSRNCTTIENVSNRRPMRVRNIWNSAKRNRLAWCDQGEKS